jgi:2,4-dienoyl-CoA reductase (NADPH2)
VATFLTAEGDQSLADWQAEWGVGDPGLVAGGLVAPQAPHPGREVWLLQRSPGRPGRRLGRTTGWVHRSALAARGVQMQGGVTYHGIDAQGVTLSVGDGAPSLLRVDTVVLCTGQEPARGLAAHLRALGVPCSLVGGADVAAELDAKRAIDQATRLALTL